MAETGQQSEVPQESYADPRHIEGTRQSRDVVTIRENPEDGHRLACEDLRGEGDAETAKEQESPLQDSKQDRKATPGVTL